MTVARYRKKPVEIEAIQWDGTNFAELAMWGAPALQTDALEWDYHAGAYVLPDGRFASLGVGGMQSGCLVIPTLEGEHLARPGDWIIRGVVGEFYPCKPDIFDDTYEEVTK